MKDKNKSKQQNAEELSQFLLNKHGNNWLNVIQSSDIKDSNSKINIDKPTNKRYKQIKDT